MALGEDDGVDEDVLARLRDLGGDDDPGFLAGLLEDFVAHADRAIEGMRGAVLAGDAKRLVEVAHGLKGSSGNVGARGLAALCAEVERSGRVGTPTAATSTIEAAAREWTRVRARFAREIRGGSA